MLIDLQSILEMCSALMAALKFSFDIIKTRQDISMFVWYHHSNQLVKK